MTRYRLAANSTLGSNGSPSGTIANTVAFAYDNIGRPISEALTTTGNTYDTSRGYDDDSRLTGLTYPDGSTVTTRYTDRNQVQDIG